MHQSAAVSRNEFVEVFHVNKNNINNKNNNYDDYDDDKNKTFLRFYLN
jgi:hypothetical protein